MEDSSKIVIRRKKKKSHEAHHGGSWKVAYADFVTAMMAFFLLLWLLSMTAPEKRIAMSQYFSDFSLFSGQSSSKGSTSIIEQQSNVVVSVNKARQKDKSKGKEEKRASPEELATMMRTMIEEKLQELKKQVLIDTTPEGLRIQIVDNEGSEIFRLGSDVPTEKAIRIIKLVSENIKEKPNRIVIEGHTDSAPFKTAQKTNWELSTSRASAARREMENNGVDPSKIARVVGYADQELLIEDNPRDARNRRISIILMQ